jgi:hypothetical protein
MLERARALIVRSGDVVLRRKTKRRHKYALDAEFSRFIE